MTEKILTAMFAIVSLLYLYFAHQLSFGSLQNPQSGFLPITIGIIAIILSFILIIKQLRSTKAESAELVNWTKFTFIFLGLIFYILFFKFLGYFFSTLFFLLYLLKIASEKTDWWNPFIISFISSTSFYLLFKYYLDVTLP